jgi:carbamoyl-phosphate synthase large subunit
MKEIIVMVTGVGGGGIGEQIIKCLRMAQTKYKIIGTDATEYSKGLMEVDIAYVVPKANDPRYIDTLLKICKKEAVSAVFPGSEPELKVISSNRQEFPDKNIFLPISPHNVIELCLDKIKTAEFLQKNGFRIPYSIGVTSLEEAEKFDILPAILKPSVGGSGSSNVFLAQTKKELSEFAKYLLNICPKIVIQEYVGTPDSEFTVGVLVGMDGKIINSIALKRQILQGLSNKTKSPNRTGRSELGEILAISTGISQGEIGRFSEITQPCEKIAVALGAKGSINVQCRFFKNQVYVFEINPRISGTTPLRAMVGYNEPDILIRKHILGEKIPEHFEYKTAVIMRGITETAIDKTKIQKV